VPKVASHKAQSTSGYTSITSVPHSYPGTNCCQSFSISCIYHRSTNSVNRRPLCLLSNIIHYSCMHSSLSNNHTPRTQQIHFLLRHSTLLERLPNLTGRIRIIQLDARLLRWPLSLHPVQDRPHHYMKSQKDPADDSYPRYSNTLAEIKCAENCANNNNLKLA